MGSNKSEIINFFIDTQKGLKIKNTKMLVSLAELIKKNDFEEIEKLYQGVKPTKYSVQGYMEDLVMDEDVQCRIYEAGYAAALIDLMKLVDKEYDDISKNKRNDLEEK